MSKKREKWTLWIDPNDLSFNTTQAIPEGAVVLKKEKKTSGYENIYTDYFLRKDKKLEQYEKREISSFLAEYAARLMKHTGYLLPNTEIGKTYKNGNTDITYNPNRANQFVMKISPEMIDGDTVSFLKNLKQHKFQTSIGIVEAASTGRASCQVCRERIEKGELRIGEKLENEIMSKSTFWTHAKCIQIPRVDGLIGYDDLTEEHKQELEESIVKIDELSVT